MFTGLVFVTVAAAGLFWRGYRRPRPRRWLIPRRPAVRVGAAAARPRCPHDGPPPAELVRTARRCRAGAVDPAALIRAGTGDHLAAVAEFTSPAADPPLVAAVAEAERLARRLGHWSRLLPPVARPAADRLAVRFANSAELRRRWLREAVRRLVAAFPSAHRTEQTAILACLDDLRADIGGLFPAVPSRRAVWWTEAVGCLRWSRSPHVGPLLAGQATALLRVDRDSPAAAVALGALRGHRCEEAEAVLLRAATDHPGDPRRAAVGAFGWWDPFDPRAVVGVLEDARFDPDGGVREAATAGLARFGERTALRDLTNALTDAAPATRRRAAGVIAAEGVTWLWPELDGLAGGGEWETALPAVEAVEQLREAAFGLTG